MAPLPPLPRGSLPPSSRPSCFLSLTRETAFSFFSPPELIFSQVGNKADFPPPRNTNKTIIRYHFYQTTTAIKVKIWKRKLTTVYNSSRRQKEKKNKSTVRAREQMADVQYGPSSVCYYFGKEGPCHFRK